MLWIDFLPDALHRPAVSWLSTQGTGKDSWVETLRGPALICISASEVHDWADKFFIAVQLSPELMPDALHPNVAGMQLLAQCLQPFTDQYLSS